MRQIVLDTETTGLYPKQGHRIVEIGCVELIDRQLTGQTYHQYINPQRDMPEEAFKVHGLSHEFLLKQPVFSQIVKDFIEFVKGSTLVIHNAPFDVGFLNHEFGLLGSAKKSLGINILEDTCSIIDSLKMAKKMRPGQKNSLDALCKSYGIDNSNRDLHGALLDSEILADVYLAMTGGQTSLSFSSQESQDNEKIIRLIETRTPTKIIKANEEELIANQIMLDRIEKKSGISVKLS
jgi:DNA polymerase-3 subunit epsilon